MELQFQELLLDRHNHIQSIVFTCLEGIMRSSMATAFTIDELASCQQQTNAKHDQANTKILPQRDPLSEIEIGN